MKALSWSNVSLYVGDRLPFREPLGRRGAMLVFGGSAGRMEVHLPCTPGEEAPKIPLAHLEAATRVISGVSYLVLAGHGLNDLRPMHQLAVLCTSFFEERGTGAAQAVLAGLRAWSQLVEGMPLLSAESRLGLRGELALLRTLIASHGPSAVSSWTANDDTVADRHDFRLGGAEIEVKATRAHARHHWISSMRQLTASPELSLFLLSLQYEPAGQSPGSTLPEVVATVRAMLDGHPADRAGFERRLLLALYRDEDAVHYDESLRLASEPSLVPVDGSWPALTPDILGSCIAPHALARLLDLRYQVDVDGLGAGPAHGTFLGIVGSWIN